eukprot:scaffold96989_cov61-Phaeocystis_antarctica.AAC.2
MVANGGAKAARVAARVAAARVAARAVAALAPCQVGREVARAAAVRAAAKAMARWPCHWPPCHGAPSPQTRPEQRRRSQAGSHEALDSHGPGSARACGVGAPGGSWKARWCTRSQSSTPPPRPAARTKLPTSSKDRLG